MRLGVDIMGGDFAPEHTLLGAIQAWKELPHDAILVLIGDKDAMLPILQREPVPSEFFERVRST